jgi:DNA-binding LytR/AlgR family response regulator
LNSIVNPTALPWSEFFPWFQVFGLPFAPIFLLLWGYLRFRFGKIELNTTVIPETKIVRIEGTNANESLELNWSDFILARSQSNYIEIFYFDPKETQTSKAIIRSTLSKVLDQLSEATQIHRSYIINLDHLVKLEGNVRKGWCHLKGIEEVVPVSPKHFKAIKMRLQNHPLNLNLIPSTSI